MNRYDNEFDRMARIVKWYNILLAKMETVYGPSDSKNRKQNAIQTTVILLI